MVMQLSGRLEGVDLSFATSLLEIREKNGVAYYKTRLPSNTRASSATKRLIASLRGA